MTTSSGTTALAVTPVPRPQSRQSAGPATETTAAQSADDLRSRTDDLRDLVTAARRGPGGNATAAQRAKGKLTVWERIDLLLDADSFVEIGGLRRHRAGGFGLERQRPHGDGVVTGWGTVEGRKVYVYAQDFRVFGGSLGEEHARKIHRIMDLAASAGAPLVSLNDSAGARIQEGVRALAGYGGIFQRNVRNSGVIPQISVMLGPCAGGAAYSPALTDAVFMVERTAQMFITGPDVVEAVTGEKITHEELGGAAVHGALSGVATFVHPDEQSCLDEVRCLLSLLPANNQEPPPYLPTSDPVDRPCDVLDLVSADPRQPYDMRDLLAEVVDDGELMEMHARWATNLICALARIGGHVVGLVANQPLVLAGVLDVAASEKGARFVQFCDAFSIPLVTFVDVPGFLPGADQEHGGIIRHGAKLLYAYCDATVPRVQVIVRKAYGGAYIVMDSLSVGADFSFAWPTNEIAVMGAQGAANVIFRRQIAAADDPEAARVRFIEQYRRELVHPYYAAEGGLVDDVIDPAATRAVLAAALDALHAKHVPPPFRKHGNPPK